MVDGLAANGEDGNAEVEARVKAEVADLCARFPIYPQLLMQLAQDSYGAAGAAPPLLIVHGLFGSARNWGAIAKRLSNDRHVIAVDMRNHGSRPMGRKP